VIRGARGQIRSAMAETASAAPAPALLRIFRRPAFPPAKTEQILAAVNEKLAKSGLPALGSVQNEFCYYVDAAAPLDDAGELP
jgi:hypothetical protein